MGKKEPYQIEYTLKASSRNLIWQLISTPLGLAKWFADEVTTNNNILIFRWGNSTQSAVIVSTNKNNDIKFRWINDPKEYYFEFKILTSELTEEKVLQINDFAEPGDKNGNIELWNSQIETLMRISGI